jgi:vesicle transport through interaction with t-SNAREs 1
MSNPLDTDAGTERFASYEAELKLVQADLNQQLDQIPELSGEPRKAAIRKAERALEEANELVRTVMPSTSLVRIKSRGAGDTSLDGS